MGTFRKPKTRRIERLVVEATHVSLDGTDAEFDIAEAPTWRVDNSQVDDLWITDDVVYLFHFVGLNFQRLKNWSLLSREIELFVDSARHPSFILSDGQWDEMSAWLSSEDELPF